MEMPATHDRPSRSPKQLDLATLSPADNPHRGHGHDASCTNHIQERPIEASGYLGGHATRFWLRLALHLYFSIWRRLGWLAENISRAQEAFRTNQADTHGRRRNDDRR